MLIKPFTILLLCFIGLASALNPPLNVTLQKNYFFLGPDGYFSTEFYQTRNGIITFNIETINQTGLVSQYLLIDMTTKDVKPILTELVQACEIIAPTYQALHYHAQTDSLVFFCSTNGSLLILDQSNYSIQTTIPLSLSENWPVFKLSTDGMNVALLFMGKYFTPSPQNSTLIRVDLQTKNIASQIVFDQGFEAGEAVVAFASNANITSVATNRIQNETLITTVYLLDTFGSTYQVTPLRNFTTPISKFDFRIVTKLFCIGNLIAVNNNRDLNIIDQQDLVTTVPKLRFLPINSLEAAYYYPVMTSQYGSNDLYAQVNFNDISKYTATGNTLTSQDFGSFGSMYVAFGSQATADLMFTCDIVGLYFTIINMQTLQPIYSAVNGYNNIMLTNTTYAVVQSFNFHNPQIYIFNSKNDTLISKYAITNDYYYTKDQQIVSFFNVSGPTGSVLAHIDLLTGNVWTTLNFPDTKKYVNCSIPALRITDNGNPEFVVQVSSSYFFYTEVSGFTQFNFSSSFMIDSKKINVDLESLTFYFYDFDLITRKTNITYYQFDPSSQQFNLLGTNLLKVPFEYGMGFVNTSQSVTVTKTSFTIINGLGDVQAPETYSFTSAWDYFTSFQDNVGNQYLIPTKAIFMDTKGSPPGLLAFGNFTSLPGVRNESVRAQSAGVNSYWVADSFSSIGLVRFYSAAVGGANEEKTLISI